MTVKKSLSICVAAAVIIALLVGGAIYFYLLFSVTVLNESSVTLSNVKVFLADKEIWSGVLAPGEVHKTNGSPDRDGTVTISFEASGKKMHKKFEYVTPRLPADYFVVVLPSLEVRYTTQ